MVTVGLDAADLRTQVERGAERDGHRSGQTVVPTTDSHRLGRGIGHVLHDGGLLRDEQERQVLRFGRVLGGLLVLDDEPRLRQQMESVDKVGQAAPVEPLGIARAIRMVRVDALTEAIDRGVVPVVVVVHLAAVSTHVGRRGPTTTADEDRRGRVAIGAARLRAQSELGNERLERDVIVVDGFTTGFGVELVGEGLVERPHSSADAITCLEHDDVPSGVAQVMGGGEPREPSPDHDDPTRGRRIRSVARNDPRQREPDTDGE